MRIAGEYTFAAPPQPLWEALLDPKVIAAVLPGCERLEQVGEGVYEGQLLLKVGPVQGSFLGKVTLQDLNPPHSYSMIVDGRGAPGFVKATVKLQLTDEGAGTRLSYDADAQVGGKIASVGQRLVESSAKAIAKQSLEGLNVLIVDRAKVVQSPVARVATEASKAQMPRSVAPKTQFAFAAGVAKEVAKDLVPARVRRGIAIALVILLAVLMYRLIF